MSLTKFYTDFVLNSKTILIKHKYYYLLMNANFFLIFIINCMQTTEKEKT